jgi:His-Xaa-Ser system radical SAM maturase HxsC
VREFAGQPVRLSNSYMGVVSRRWFSTRNTILLVDSKRTTTSLLLQSLSHPNVVGCIISNDIQVEAPAWLSGVVRLSANCCSMLNDGDVVLINPDGKVTVLYEIKSPHNIIAITNRCNCKCVMCPQPADTDGDTLTEDNEKLIRLMNKKQTKYLGITGGEPTLFEDRLVRLIHECQTWLPRTDLTLLTNGRRLKDLDFAKKLVEAGYPQLTIDVPLYADNDDSHDGIMGVRGSFYETLKGLHNLALLRQDVRLRTVLHGLTVGRLPQFCEFVYRNLPFVRQVAFMGMETTGLAKENLDYLWVDPFDYRDELKAAVRHLTRRSIPVSIYNHQLCILPRDLWSFARRSISTWKEMYLEECNECTVKDTCCGFFATGERTSSHINAVL